MKTVTSVKDLGIDFGIPKMTLSSFRIPKIKRAREDVHLQTEGPTKEPARGACNSQVTSCGTDSNMGQTKSLRSDTRNMGGCGFKNDSATSRTLSESSSLNYLQNSKKSELFGVKRQREPIQILSQITKSACDNAKPPHSSNKNGNVGNAAKKIRLSQSSPTATSPQTVTQDQGNGRGLKRKAKNSELEITTDESPRTPDTDKLHPVTSIESLDSPLNVSKPSPLKQMALNRIFKRVIKKAEFQHLPKITEQSSDVAVPVPMQPKKMVEENDIESKRLKEVTAIQQKAKVADIRPNCLGMGENAATSATLAIEEKLALNTTFQGLTPQAEDQHLPNATEQSSDVAVPVPMQPNQLVEENEIENKRLKAIQQQISLIRYNLKLANWQIDWYGIDVHRHISSMLALIENCPKKA